VWKLILDKKLNGLYKLKVYLVSRRKQILRMCNDRMSVCMKTQQNFKEDQQFIRLGLELRVLRTIQEITGITDEELLKILNEGNKNKD